ncbi:MAG: hypothetical protein OXH90_08665 [Paracoccaceae bacterium]|nr:hypothetical protein [Paracoccaceae bacterium]MDE2918132.1 hypothetical protein [Paracoccaceae bacterium]
MHENFDKTLKEIIQKRLEPAEIVRLSFKEDEDADGDPIMRIRIVFKADEDLLDPNKTLGLARHLRETMGNIFIERHPIFYFRTQEEDESLAAN